MKKKRPIVTGTFKCARKPYKGFEEKKGRPDPDINTAILLEFIGMGAIGGKRRSLNDIEKITPNEAFIQLAKMAPLAIWGELERWQTEGARGLWIDTLIKHRRLLPFRKINTACDFLPKDSMLGSYYRDLNDFACKAKFEKEPDYVRAFRRCKSDYVNLHRLIYQLMAPAILLAPEPSKYRFHFSNPDYLSYLQHGREWQKQTEIVDRWVETLKSKVEIKEICTFDNYSDSIPYYFIVDKEYLYLSIITLSLFNLITKAFKPYSNQYVSLGQLHIGICFNCGTIITRRQLNVKSCDETCRQAYSRNNPTPLK